MGLPLHCYEGLGLITSAVICGQGIQRRLGSSEEGAPEQCVGKGISKSRETHNPRGSMDQAQSRSLMGLL